MESLWTWLSTPPGKDGVLDLFGVLCLLLFGPGYMLSAYLAGTGTDRLGKDPVQRTGIRHWASIGLWVFGAGLLFFGARVLQINPLWFGAPIWLVASIFVLVFAAVRCCEWWRTIYPAELARSFSADAVYPRSDMSSLVSGASPKQPIPESTVQR